MVSGLETGSFEDWQTGFRQVSEQPHAKGLY